MMLYGLKVAVDINLVKYSTCSGSYNWVPCWQLHWSQAAFTVWTFVLLYIYMSLCIWNTLIYVSYIL